MSAIRADDPSLPALPLLFRMASSETTVLGRQDGFTP